jgi:hypothetical protein
MTPRKPAPDDWTPLPGMKKRICANRKCLRPFSAVGNQLMCAVCLAPKRKQRAKPESAKNGNE